MTINPDSQIATPIQIEALVTKLGEWRAQLEQRQIKQRLNLGVPIQIDPLLWQDFLKLRLPAELETVEGVDSAISTIQTWLKTAPVLHITFSSPADHATRIAIIEWLHQQLDPAILAEFIVDSSIAAGFVLRTKNHVYNFTANHLLWQSREQIGELVKHV